MEIGFSSPPFSEGRRVLVVDDDPVFLSVAERTLKICSYEVTTCPLAREALEILRKRKGSFDIVITDVNMPDMDGFELLEHIVLEMDLPVILISVDGETSKVMKGVLLGACDYLVKPVGVKELKNIWQHVFRKKTGEIKSAKSHECRGDTQMMRIGSDESDDISNVGALGVVNTETYMYGKRENQMIRNGSDVSNNGHLVTESELGVANEMKNKKKRSPGDKEDVGPSISKKSRVVWSEDLHKKFVDAVNVLGLDNVTPMKILKLMNVPHLTRENVSSHLQKYRQNLNRLKNVDDSNSFWGTMLQACSLDPNSFWGTMPLACSLEYPPGSLGLQSSTKIHHRYVGDNCPEPQKITSSESSNVQSFVPCIDPRTSTLEEDSCSHILFTPQRTKIARHSDSNLFEADYYGLSPATLKAISRLTSDLNDHVRSPEKICKKKDGQQCGMNNCEDLQQKGIPILASPLHVDFYNNSELMAELGSPQHNDFGFSVKAF